MVRRSVSRIFRPMLALVAGLVAAEPVRAAPFDDAAAGRARMEFERRMAVAQDAPLPRLSDIEAAPLLRAIWNGIDLAPNRRFEAQDVPTLFRTCGSGQSVLVRYFDADGAAAAASVPPEERFGPEILEGVDFMIRCAAALLQANGDASRRQLPGVAFAESREGSEQLRGQLVEQFNGPLRAISAGALSGEPLDRLAVAFRESAPRVAGILPAAERDALVALARQAAAVATPLAKADLGVFAEAVAGR
jgi:hypothetical protein